MRWIVLAMLLAVTSINYLDRLMLSVLAPILRESLHFSDSLYGNISGVFQICYAVGFLFMGRLLDRYGTKKGLAIAAAVWSLASAMHASVTSAAQFGAWRGLLGFSEGANFPACTKAVAEWFPEEERALATGIFNAGVNLASVVGPPMFVALTAHFGWRACFLSVSLAGFIWVAVWLAKYKTPTQTLSTTNAPTKTLTTREALRFRQTWGFMLGKALVDPSFFFLLFWLPLYFHDVMHLQMAQIGWALPFIYFMSGVGSITVGWLSGFLLRRGWSRRRSRITSILLCAIIVPIAIWNALGGSVTHTVIWFSLAAFAHQAFSSLAYTMPGDVFPSSAVGTVQGLGGFTGSVMSVIFSAVLPGYLIPVFGYTPLLITLSFGYLAAVFVYSRTYGDFQRVELGTNEFAPAIVLQ